MSTKANAPKINLQFERQMTLRANITKEHQLDEFIALALAVFSSAAYDVVLKTKNEVLQQFDAAVDFSSDGCDAFLAGVKYLSVECKLDLAKTLNDIWQSFAANTKGLDAAHIALYNDNAFADLADNDFYYLFDKIDDTASKKFERFMKKADREAFMHVVLKDMAKAYTDALSTRDKKAALSKRKAEIQHAKDVLEAAGYSITKG
jgi:hypothetical protein